MAAFELLDTLAPAGTGAEALTWLTTAGAAGTAVGAIVAGRLASAGHLSAALALPCVAAGLTALAVVVRRDTLRAALANGGH